MIIIKGIDGGKSNVNVIVDGKSQPLIDRAYPVIAVDSGFINRVDVNGVMLNFSDANGNSFSEKVVYQSSYNPDYSKFPQGFLYVVGITYSNGVVYIASPIESWMDFFSCNDLVWQCVGGNNPANQPFLCYTDTQYPFVSQ
jgi:hypothetical protein